ncbi:MAG: NERD domain-containing protein, partial [Verrucomicrobia bacterium]
MATIAATGPMRDFHGWPAFAMLRGMEHGLQWRFFVGVGVGLFLAIGALWGVLKWQRWQLRRLGFRPPQSGKLLRPPGHSLEAELEKLKDESEGALLVLMGAFCLLGLALVGTLPAIRVLIQHPHEVWAFIWSSGQWPGWLALGFGNLGALLLAIYGLLRIARIVRQRRTYQLGLRGEQAVAETLLRPAVLRAGYVSFHDVPTDNNGNIDHLVVGPAGV